MRVRGPPCLRCAKATVAVLLLGSVFAQAPARADADTKRAQIEQLLEISGTAEATTQMVQTLLPPLLDMLRRAFSGAPPAVMESFEQEVARELQATTPELLDELADMYGRHFSEADVKALVKFWKSSADRKMAEAMPRMTQEGLTVGQAWGQRAAVRALDRLQRRAQEGAL